MTTTTSTRLPLSTLLRRLGACSGRGESTEWAEPYGEDYERAYQECQRGDWLLWLVGRCDQSEPWSDGRKPLVACAMECALLVKHLWPKEQAGRIGCAVETIYRWVRGEANAEEAKAASKEFYFDAAAADAAAYAAADAAYAAYAAAYAADDAAGAAADARKEMLAKCAVVVRKHYSFADVFEAAMLKTEGK